MEYANLVSSRSTRLSAISSLNPAPSPLDVGLISAIAAICSFVTGPAAAAMLRNMRAYEGGSFAANSSIGSMPGPIGCEKPGADVSRPSAR